MGTSTIGLRLSEETKKRLDALSKIRDRTPHYLMKTAVERFLDIEEAIEVERDLVRARWHSFELTGEATSHADVQRWADELVDR